MKLIFAVLYVPLNNGPYTLFNGSFVHCIVAVFRPQSIAEILPLPHLEKNERHMEILHPVSIYRHLRVILQRRNKFCLNWTITERVMTLLIFFKMAAIPSQIFFSFLVL